MKEVWPLRGNGERGVASWGNGEGGVASLGKWQRMHGLIGEIVKEVWPVGE